MENDVHSYTVFIFATQIMKICIVFSYLLRILAHLAILFLAILVCPLDAKDRKKNTDNPSIQPPLNNP